MRSLATVLRVSSAVLEDRDQKSLTFSFGKCWLFFYLLLTCWKAHSFRTKRNAFMTWVSHWMQKRDAVFCLSCFICNKLIVKHWLTNLHPTHTEKFNKLISNKLHCAVTLFRSACWCQGFKTLFSVLFSLFVFQMSVFYVKESFTDFWLYF